MASKKDKRNSGRILFQSYYYDEQGNKIDYIFIQWSNWDDVRDGFRNPDRKSWKSLYKVNKQYLKHTKKPIKRRGWKN